MRRYRHRRPQTAVIVSLALVLMLGFLVWSGATAAHADGPTEFTSSTPITMTSPPSGGTPAAASPYPSAVTVSGMTGPVSDVDVRISGFTHSVANDVDILLVGPTGQSLVLLSDPGGRTTLVSANNATVTFDDGAATGVPQSGVITGTVRYRPTDTDAGEGTADSFPAPAPAPGANTTLADAFTGTTANGVWNLFVVDDTDGDNGSISGGWSLTVTTAATAAPTTTAVASSQNPSTTGGAVTFTATVTSAGSPVNAGSVTFSDGSTTLAADVAVNASGRASFTTSTLAEGSHVIVARYNGTPTLLSSSGSLTQVVDNATTTPDGDTWCNTGNITVPTSGAGTPYPSHITVGGAGPEVSRLTVDLDDVSHAVPVDLEVLLVGPTGRTLVLMSDVGGTSPGTADLTFDDRAAGPVAAGGPLTSGTYRPSDDDSGAPDAPPPAPAPAPSGATTLATFDGTNPNGTWSLFVYDDATADAGSLSGWCLNVSTAAPTATTVQSSANPSTVGQPVTFTATVTSGGSPVTAGTVDFTEGGAALATAVPVNGSGRATFSTSTLAVGSHPVTASYAGTLAFQPSQGTLTQVVQRATSGTTLTSSANPSTVGQPVTFTATVTSGGGPVTAGTVDFTEGGTTLAAGVALDASGRATFTTDALAAGSHPVTAAYNGSAAVAPSQDTLTQVVQAAPVVSTDPVDVVVAAGADATFTAAASGSPAPSVQWQVDTGSGFADLPGATSTTLHLSAVTVAMDGNRYRAVFTNPAGSATTAAATLTVTAGPVVTTDPVDAVVPLGASATFTAAASGNPPPSVQWQVDTGGGFADVPGATSTTLHLSAVTLAMDGNRYRAVFTNGSGSTPSAAATLRVGCPVGTSPTVTCAPNQAGGLLMRGSSADETFVGSPGPDTLVGRGGGDLMRGLAGADVLSGGPGPDRLLGGRGADRLWGDGGADLLRGGEGPDDLHGGPGPDRAFGGPGADELWGDGGADLLRGGRGPDVLHGGPGPDRVLGGPGADELWGGRGADVLRGRRGPDVLHGGPGRDRLVGGPGADRIFSGRRAG